MCKSIRCCGAFTLLEVVVYIFLFSFISLALGRLVITVHRAVTVAGKKYQKIIKQKLCFDIMWRDFVCARTEKKYWNERRCIFKTKNRDVQFFVKEGKLYKRAGKYDFVKKYWIKRSTCAGLDQYFITNFSINLVYSSAGGNTAQSRIIPQNRVIGVLVTWGKEKKYIALRNDRTLRSYCTC